MGLSSRFDVECLGNGWVVGETSVGEDGSRGGARGEAGVTYPKNDRNILLYLFNFAKLI